MKKTWIVIFQEAKARGQRTGPQTLLHTLGHFCPGENDQSKVIWGNMGVLRHKKIV